MRKLLFCAYVFYRWKEEETFEDIWKKVEEGADTMHTLVMFYNDSVVLQKTEDSIHNNHEYNLKLTYDEFVELMLSDRVQDSLYDFEQAEL